MKDQMAGRGGGGMLLTLAFFLIGAAVLTPFILFGWVESVWSGRPRTRLRLDRRAASRIVTSHRVAGP